MGSIAKNIIDMDNRIECMLVVGAVRRKNIKVFTRIFRI